jgi:hypothetical protein
MPIICRFGLNAITRDEEFYRAITRHSAKLLW